MSNANITGNVRLGYTEVSDQQPGALGEEFTVVPSEYDSAGDVYVESHSGAVRVKLVHNSSGAVMAPGKVVKRDTTGNMAYDVTLAGAAAPGCGIVDPTLTEDVAIDAKFLIVTYGETDVLVGGSNLSKGNTIQAGAAGVNVVDAVSTVAELAAAHGVMLEAGTASTLAKAFVDFRAIK